MKNRHFKTNIKCMGCVATVTPFLEKAEGVEQWTVDLEHPDKVLTARLASDAAVQALQSALMQAGYSAELMD